MTLVGSPELAPAGRMASIVPGRRASMFPEAAPPALGIPADKIVSVGEDE